MFFRGRLRNLLNRNVQIATPAGLYEGTLVEVEPLWVKLDLTTSPGYPPVRNTVFLQAVGFVRIL